MVGLGNLLHVPSPLLKTEISTLSALNGVLRTSPSFNPCQLALSQQNIPPCEAYTVAICLCTVLELPAGQWPAEHALPGWQAAHLLHLMWHSMCSQGTRPI